MVSKVHYESSAAKHYGHLVDHSFKLPTSVYCALLQQCKNDFWSHSFIQIKAMGIIVLLKILHVI